MASVVLDSVSRRYPGGTLAVDQVDLEVRDKEFLVLVGPSGCGKSTTLRMIAGLEEIDRGEIRIAERVVNQVPPKDRDIAMVFQNYALYPHMTVWRNMAFGLQLRYGGNWLSRFVQGIFARKRAAIAAQQRKQINDKVCQAAEDLGIEHLLDRLPKQLSGGERQRVALGRAIVREPAAFLFDEPLSNLDAKLRVETRKLIKRLHRQLQTTMIYVTHDQVEALTLGDRIAIMNRGKILQVGSAMEVYDRPQNLFVAGFMGTPSMNLVKGEIRQQADELRFCSAESGFPLNPSDRQLLSSLPGKSFVFGIRPEDLVLSDQGDQQAEVLLVEPLGDAQLVYLKWPVTAEGENADASFVMKTDSRTRIVSGERVRFQIDAERRHWFDAETGDRLMAS